MTQGASALSARSRMTQSCVAIGVFEGRGAKHRDLGRLRERAHVNPHQSHLHFWVQFWRPQHRKLMAMTEQVPRRPTEASHRGSGYGDWLREQALLRLEKKSLWRGLPGAFPNTAVGDFYEKQRCFTKACSDRMKSPGFKLIQGIFRLKEDICSGGGAETVEQVSQRSCACPMPGSV